MPHPATAFFVHPYTELVLIGATQLGALEPLDVDDREQLMKEKAISHEMPLCAALYNENFDQVSSRGLPKVLQRRQHNTIQLVIMYL